jgi:hypothetical protein
VILAVTQDIDGSALQAAIATESERRRMPSFGHFFAPASWGPSYQTLARPIPRLRGVHRFDAAKALVASLIDPALDGSASGQTWRAATRNWRTYSARASL